MSHLVGYARVSTIVQDLSSQITSLENAGCKKIFSGKYSGSSKDNDAQLQSLIDYVRDDDVVVVTRLDRLGRSLKAILRTIDKIHEKNASLRTLDGSLDTSQRTALSQAMVSLIGVFAQLERDLILDRTSEGRAAAIEAGKHMGRPPKIRENERKQIRKRLKSESVSKLSREFQVSRQTIMRIRDET